MYIPGRKFMDDNTFNKDNTVSSIKEIDDPDKTIGLDLGEGPSISINPENNADFNGDTKIDISNIWSEWKVIDQIGEGSYGKVYKIIREEHGFTDQSALKIIQIPKNSAELNSVRSEGHDDFSIRTYFESIVKDFVNEIKIMASLKGMTNIVSIEDYKVVERSSEIGWDIYIRMELLTNFIDHITGKKQPESEIIKIGQDVCSALELCARNGIIHRDIKPENIFVSSHGDFKVGDFGIAREMDKTRGFMSAKGTPSYIAPEVELSKEYGVTVDIYSLGIVLYKLLNNNRLPFMDQNTSQIMYHDYENAKIRRLRGEALPAPVEASRSMADVILKACQFDPAKRFKTAAEFKAALGAVKRGEYKHRSINPAHAIIAGCVIVSITGLSVLFIIKDRDRSITTPSPAPFTETTSPTELNSPAETALVTELLPSPAIEASPSPETAADHTSEISSPDQLRAFHVEEDGENIESISLVEGESKILYVVTDPTGIEANIFSASDNPKVLDVVLVGSDEIKVTGISGGNTILTITAEDIIRSYRVSVYSIITPVHDMNDYIFPFSSDRLITDAELNSVNRRELRLARNEIYARLGRMFADQELQDYFNSKPWYTPIYGPEEFDAYGESILSSIEIENLHRIRAREG